MSPRLVLIPRESARPESRAQSPESAEPPREQATPVDQQDEAQREIEQLWWWAGL